MMVHYTNYHDKKLITKYNDAHIFWIVFILLLLTQPTHHTYIKIQQTKTNHPKKQLKKQLKKHPQKNNN